jgi:hypothetical protein
MARVEYKIFDIKEPHYSHAPLNIIRKVELKNVRRVGFIFHMGELKAL